MLIGKAGSATTSICTADAASIEVRGKDLCRDLMGRITFTEYFFLLVTGREPTAKQRFFLDLLLVAIAEHGLTPTAQAARMTYASDPACLQAAVAAGILGCGSVVLGTSELCGRVLMAAQERVKAGASPNDAVLAIATETRARGDKLPGFGHPVHHPVDPRAERIFELADREGVAGSYAALARLFPAAAAQAWKRPLPMNVSMAIAAVLLDLDFPAAIIKGIPLLARTAGLLGHLAEEQEHPIGFLMAHHGEEAITYEKK
ncbi:MAG: citryl-CoA lyase [Proteobacteria bacterium]|nr:citryl-CoA lyase [Pseudomonadota bacterium]